MKQNHVTLDELNFFHAAVQGDKVLTDEQIAEAERTYHAEKDAGLGELLHSLNTAVGPACEFTKA